MATTVDTAIDQFMQEQEKHLERVTLHALEHGCIPTHAQAETTTGIIAHRVPATIFADQKALRKLVKRIERKVTSHIKKNDKTGRFSLAEVQAADPFEDYPDSYSLHVTIDIHEKEPMPTS